MKQLFGRGRDNAGGSAYSSRSVAAADPPEAQLAEVEPVQQTAAELAEARALVGQLRRRCELCERELEALRREPVGDSSQAAKLVQAWSESAALRELLDEREQTHRVALSEADCLRRREAALREALDEVAAGVLEWRAAAIAECDSLKRQLAQRERSLQSARTAASDAEQREAMARTLANDLAEEHARVSAQMTQLEQALAHATAARGQAEDEAREAAEDVEALEARAQRRAADAERLRREVVHLERRLANQLDVEDDLRALLETERKQASDARRLAETLRAQLSNLPGDKLVDTERAPLVPTAAPSSKPDDWSAIDEILVSRIEHAEVTSPGKATRS